MRLLIGIVFGLWASVCTAKVSVEYTGFVDTVSTTSTYVDGALVSLVEVMVTEESIYTTYYHRDGMECKHGDAFTGLAKYNGQNVKISGFCIYNEELDSVAIVFRPKSAAGLVYVVNQFKTNKLVTIEYLNWFTGIKTDGFNAVWGI